MTNQNQTVRDDIAFMRQLAEAGAQAPQLGGSILVASGLLFGTASLTIWGALTQGIRSPAVHLAWPISGLLFLGALVWIKSRLPRAVGSGRATGIAWSGVGWAMCVAIFSLLIMANRSGDWRVAAAISPIMLALYGAAWFVAGVATRTGWQITVAAATFVMALVVAWFSMEGALTYLLYAISLYLLVALPGFVMMRQARQAV